MSQSYNVGDRARTPAGTAGTIIAQEGGQSWLKSAKGKNFFRNTADLLPPLPQVGDSVLTPKGNRATIRAIVDGQAWVLTARGRNVVRELDALRAA